MTEFYHQARLYGEIRSLDNEILARKKSFGVELYSIIMKHQKGIESAQNGGGGGGGGGGGASTLLDTSSVLEIPNVFKTVENEIKPVLDEYSVKIRVHELELKQVHKDIQNAPMGLGGWWMCRWVQVKYLEHEIYTQKQEFGIQVWDVVGHNQEWFVTAMKSNTRNKSGTDAVTGSIGGFVQGLRGSVENAVGAITETVSVASGVEVGDNKAIVACVDKAKEDIHNLEEKRAKKDRLLDHAMKRSKKQKNKENKK